MLLAKRTAWTGPEDWNIFQELQIIEYNWYMDVKQRVFGKGESGQRSAAQSWSYGPRNGIWLAHGVSK